MFLIPPSSYKVKATKKKGRGVFATRDIESGSVIGDYIGKIMRPEHENERRDGLYTMSGGEFFDILANPKDHGIHLINHGCAQNCVIYPYKGHTLFIALRKIFAGEELILNYMLGQADEKDIPCSFHACHCGSKICTGSMHDNEHDFEAWEKITRKEYGPWYKKMPGRYGEMLSSLDSYPVSITIDNQAMGEYNVYGSEAKPPLKNSASTMPKLNTLRKIIRETGRQQSFTKMHIQVFGIQNNLLLIERI